MHCFTWILAAKEREKAEKAKAGSGPKTPVKAATPATQKKGATPAKGKGAPQSQKDLDMAGMNLNEKEDEQSVEPPPKVAMAREKLLEEVATTIAAQKQDKPAISLVVIGERTDGLDKGKR
jgi:hypothetical protein